MDCGTSVTSPASQLLRNLRQWQSFLLQCLSQRKDLATFERFAELQQAKYPLPPGLLADLFFSPRPKNDDYIDPLLPRYVQILLHLKYVDVQSILHALYKYSTSHSQAQQQQPAADGDAGDTAPPSAQKLLRWGSSYGHEETIFYRLTKAVGQGTGIRDVRSATDVVQIMARWMRLFTAASATFAADAMRSLEAPPSQTEMESARAAFVMLLLSVCENQMVLHALSQPYAKSVRASLSESLASFIPSIQLNSSQIATRLELFRTETLAGFEPVDKKKAAQDAEIDDLLDSTMGLQNFVIPELTIANSRAGLYIYLNAALVGRPLIEDDAIFNYLHNRYQGDAQTTAIDLILASFDVLANAVYRSEGQKAAHLLRSYLINKVPLLLASFAASPVYAFDAQFCISQALSRIDQNAFPTLSAMFEDTRSNNTFNDGVRQDFCFACCLHGLVPETSIETLLGEITYQTLPAGGRYVKEHLVQDCMADPEKIQSLIGELDYMDGNVGAVCQALTVVLGQLCDNKETMSLKNLCTQLARNPLYLDVLLLFDKPTTILQPLCELLDNWRYDEDQGEYQPVYEEFGCVLLLVLAFAYRYNLSAADLGVRSPDSFVAKLLTKGHLCRSSSDLSEQEKEHLGGWVRGLFDGDAGGLGDDLMSSCPPQEFYMLIPTMFHHMTTAFSLGVLTEEVLKSGIEYLVDTFLLPSLVTAMLYLSNALWVDRPADQRSIVRILQLIIQPSSISNEASAMHSAVLNIVAKPLEHSLRAYQRLNPKNQDVDPLLRALKENIPLSRRTGAAEINELEAWAGTANGGFAAAVRHMVQSFVQWSHHAGAGAAMRTSYNHRQFLAALRMLGATRLLDIVLDEVRHQAEAGSGAIAYDVACALVCAQDVTNASPEQPQPQLPPVQRRITLREALKSRAEDWKKIQTADPLMAETVVRLYRKVEAQMTPPPEPVIAPDLGLVDATAAAAVALDDAMAVAAAAAAAGAAPGDAMNLDTVDLGLGGAGADLGGDLGLGGSAANSTGGLDLNDDIFGGLGALDGWDIDMS